jgi:hypothetical protein
MIAININTPTKMPVIFEFIKTVVESTKPIKSNNKISNNTFLKLTSNANGLG